MDDAGEQESPPAGWYSDPYDSQKQRYWDGTQWTDQVQDGLVVPFQPTGTTPLPPGPGPGLSGGLGNLGSWMSDSFSVIGKAIRPIGLLLFVGPLLLIWAWALVVMALLSSVQVTAGELEAQGDSILWLAVVVGIGYLIISFGVLLQAMAAIDQMYSTLAASSRTLGQSMRLAIRRLFPAIGWGALIGLGLVVAYFAYLAVAVVAYDLAGAAGWLVFLVAFLGGCALVWWVWIKLCFVSVAVVINPGHSPISASAAISKGRFWGVLGRLLLWWIIIWVISMILSNFVTGAWVLSLGAESWIQSESTDTLLLNGIDPYSDTYQLGDVFPSMSAMLSLLTLYAFINCVSFGLGLSGVIALYRRAGGAVVDGR